MTTEDAVQKAIQLRDHEWRDALTAFGSNPPEYPEDVQAWLLNIIEKRRPQWPNE